MDRKEELTSKYSDKTTCPFSFPNFSFFDALSILPIKFDL